MKLDVSASNKLGQPFCSIQVTSENGALCIINPLFIHEHGDKWLTNVSQNKVEEKRKSVLWCYQQSVKRKNTGFKTPPLHEERPEELSHDVEEKDNNQNHQDEADWKLDIFGHLSINKSHDDHAQPVEAPNNFYDTEHSESQNGSERETKLELDDSQKGYTEMEEMKNKTLENEPCDKKESFSPHRVSWIENVKKGSLKKYSSETSLISSDSFLLPPLPELDSVSISSVEEDKDCHSLHHNRKHSHGLGNIVRHSLLAVSTVLTGLVSPEKHLGNRMQQLSEDPSTYLGCKVQTFINHFKELDQHQSSTEVLQEIRQQLTILKTYLLESNEIWEIMEHHEIEASKIDSIIETSLHKCLLKPLRDVIYSKILEIHTQDGSITRLLANQRKMKTESLDSQQPRSRVPGPAIMEKIQQKFSQMHLAYSPEKMIILLLKVCKLIYESMEATSGKKEAFGADDFLPVLIQVLMASDLKPLQLDVEYMMELVDPLRLQGEGGYYLTTMFGALYHISSFNMVSRQLSVEAQNSIRQWQRRRTIHHKDSVENRIRIARKVGKLKTSVK
ncbi:ras and Rab interactor 3-like isoform 1-T2 [Discoglossus pictus]